MDVNAIGLNDRRGRGIAVEFVRGLRSCHVNNFLSNLILPVVQVDAHYVQLFAIGCSGRQPDLIAQYDRAAPAFVVDGDFPAEIFLFAEGDRQSLASDMPSPLGPRNCGQLRQRGMERPHNDQKSANKPSILHGR